MAGTTVARDGLAKLFQQQMEMLDAPPKIETYDVLADDHAVVLNTVRASRAGQILEQQQMVVMHIKDGKITETWLQFSEQQVMDEMSSCPIARPAPIGTRSPVVQGYVPRRC